MKKILNAMKMKLWIAFFAIISVCCCFFAFSGVATKAALAAEAVTLPQSFTCDGASVRIMPQTTESGEMQSGLRFEFSMSLDDYNRLVENKTYKEGVSFGILVALSTQQDATFDEVLTLETQASNANIKNVPVYASNWKIKEKDNKVTTFFNIYNWPESQYANNIFARGYAKIGEGEGDILYTRMVERSMSYVANMALRVSDSLAEGTTGKLSTVEREHVEGYLTNYNQEILSDNLQNTIIKKTSGENKGKWEITAAAEQGDIALMHGNGIRFSSVVNKDFFKESKAYIAFDIKMQNVQALSIATLVNDVEVVNGDWQYGVVDDWAHINNFTYSGGNLSDVYENVRFYDEYGNPVAEMENGKWYTVRIRIDYNKAIDYAVETNLANITTDVHIGFQAIGNTQLKVWCGEPAYYDVTEFMGNFEFNPYTSVALTEGTATLTREESGEHAGEWKFSATTDKGIYWEKGLKLTDLLNNRDFFKGNDGKYKYVQFTITMQNVASIQGVLSVDGNSAMNYVGGNADTPINNLNNMATAWSQTMGKDIAYYTLDPNYWTFYDTNGNRVTALENDRPYTVRLYIPHDGTVEAADVYLGFMGENNQAPTVYVTDPIYSSSTVIQNPYFTESANASITKVWKKDDNGKDTTTVDYYRLAGSSLSWNSGLKISGLSSYDPTEFSSSAYDRAYFNESYAYVEFEMRMSGVTAIEANYSLTGGGDYKVYDVDNNLWCQITDLSGVDGNYWQFYLNGKRVNSMSADGATWYTVRLITKYDGTTIDLADIYLGFEGTDITVDVKAPSFNGYYTTNAMDTEVTRETTAGAFTGKWKLEQQETELFQTNGIRFTDLYADENGYGNAYKNGYKYVSTKFYVTNAEKISLYSSIEPGAKVNVTGTPITTLPSGEDVAVNYFYFYDENGNRVYSIENGKWYTLCIFLYYWETTTSADVSFGFKASDGEKVTVYLEDPVYSTENPYAG